MGQTRKCPHRGTVRYFASVTRIWARIPGARCEESVKVRSWRGTLPPMKNTLAVLAFAMPLSLLAADPPAEGTNSIGMKLVRIGPGEFTMGAGTEAPKSIDLW